MASTPAPVFELRQLEPMPDVVAVAERLLVEAKAGRIRSIAAATDMGTGTSTWQAGSARDRTAIYFALARLQDQIMVEAREAERVV